MPFRQDLHDRERTIISQEIATSCLLAMKNKLMNQSTNDYLYKPPRLVSKKGNKSHLLKFRWGNGEVDIYIVQCIISRDCHVVPPRSDEQIKGETGSLTSFATLQARSLEEL